MPTCRSCGTKKIAEFASVTDSVSNTVIPFSLCAGCGSLQHDLAGYQENFAVNSDIYGSLGDHYSMFCIELAQRLFRDMPVVRYMPPGTAFNLECNDGYFASQWVSRGWTVFGSCLSKISQNRASEKGIRAIQGCPTECSLPPLNAFFAETSYSLFNNPFAQFDAAVKNIVAGGVVFIHGNDPTSPELMDESMIGEFVSYYSRTLPSPQRIIEWMRNRGFQLVERYHLGPSMDLMFLKV